MMMKILLFLVFLTGSTHCFLSCEQCLSSGNHYCADTKLCNTPVCVNTITKAINCPRAPNATYDDNEARTKWLPLFGAGATNEKMAQKCFDNNWPTMKLSKRILVDCSDPSPILPSELFFFETVRNSRWKSTQNRTQKLGNSDFLAKMH